MTDQKIVFITGASSDIGLVLCRVYLDADYKVIGHYRTPRKEFDDLCNSDENMQSIQIDFSVSGALETALEEQSHLFCSVDILVNLASSLPNVSFEKATAKDIISTMQTNLVPGMLLMQTMGTLMAERGWGRIVQASSIGVKFGGGKESFVYSLSKHALEFIPSSVREWAKKNVLMNVIRIGVTDTHIHKATAGKDMKKRVNLMPMGRMATPEEIAKVIYGLASKENTFITGQVIAVSGGE